MRVEKPSSLPDYLRKKGRWNSPSPCPDHLLVSSAKWTSEISHLRARAFPQGLTPAAHGNGILFSGSQSVPSARYRQVLVFSAKKATWWVSISSCLREPCDVFGDTRNMHKIVMCPAQSLHLRVFVSLSSFGISLKTCSSSGQALRLPS